jgi:hypothetical protein
LVEKTGELPMSTAVAVPELVPPALAARATSLIEQARALQITDQASLDIATNYLGVEAELRKKIEAHHAPMKAAAWAAHQEALKAEKRALEENCGPIRALLTPKITAFQEERRRRVLEEQRRLQEEANRQAEEQRLAEAALLAEQGVSEADVDAVLEAPIEAPYVPPAEVKLGGGVSERWQYSAQVVDLMTLLKAVVSGAASLSCIEANMQYLNARARSDKRNFAIAGCRLVEKPALTVRRQQ